MNNWWYEKDGVASGPIALDELRKQILSGSVDIDALVWSDGMPEWRPASSIDDLRSLPPPLPRRGNINPILTPKQTDATSTGSSDVNGDGNIATHSEQGEKTISGNSNKIPWRRFFARTFDFMWCNLVLSAAFYYFSSLAIEKQIITSQVQMNNMIVLLIVFMQPVSMFMDAIISSTFGSNLGKMLLGVKVVTINGAPLTFQEHLKRNFNWMVSGQGVSLPLISTATNLYQFFRLRSHGSTSYDDGRFIVVALDKYDPIPFAALSLAVIYAYSLI